MSWNGLCFKAGWTMVNRIIKCACWRNVCSVCFTLKSNCAHRSFTSKCPNVQCLSDKNSLSLRPSSPLAQALMDIHPADVFHHYAALFIHTNMIWKSINLLWRDLERDWRRNIEQHSHLVMNPRSVRSSVCSLRSSSAVQWECLCNAWCIVYVCWIQ